MRNAEFIKRLKSSFSYLIPHSAFRILYLKRFFIPQSAIRIPHYSMGQQKVLFLLALLILALLYFKFYFRRSPPPEETYQEMVIEIVGEVQKPGLYIFKNPPTLIEAVEKAGGLKESARFEATQSSELLETGTLLTVSRQSSKEIKIALARMDARKLLTFFIPLDLNRVSVEDLCLIPGIGESLAREIVTYRERRRGFRSVEELKNVKGIEKKKYDSFKAFFTVRP
jgi:competence protein ComEA